MPCRRMLLLTFLVAFVAPLTAQEEGTDATTEAAEIPPLFASDDLIEVTIEGPLSGIFKERDRDEREEVDAVFRFTSPEGIEHAFDIQLRLRGFFRAQRSTCKFPPIRVNFKKSQVRHTLFHSQDKLKLVTHCHDRRPEYEQYLLHEYLVYRTYNLFTDYSFRARLMRVTYVDTDGKFDPTTKYAFFIEDEEALAKRNGFKVLRPPVVDPMQLDRKTLALYEIFQFFIGNTDWSTFFPKQGERECCHNGRLIGDAEDWFVVSVPYDFDWSGVINTPYAEPAPVLGIKSVRERRFWGYCRPPQEMEPVFEMFHQKRQEIYDLYRNQPDFDPARAEETIAYFDEFYEIIEDDEQVMEQMVGKCRGPK